VLRRRIVDAESIDARGAALQLSLTVSNAELVVVNQRASTSADARQ
jgi:hypothetical protein